MDTVKVGDGVMYFGSVEDAHGLYVVIGESVAPNRYHLGSPESGAVLYDARQTSFEVLLSAPER